MKRFHIFMILFWIVSFFQPANAFAKNCRSSEECRKFGLCDQIGDMCVATPESCVKS